MEEQQIQEFIHRVSVDQTIRYKLINDPSGVIACQGFSPRVALIISRLLPHLASGQAMQSAEQWWHA